MIKCHSQVRGDRAPFNCIVRLHRVVFGFLRCRRARSGVAASRRNLFDESQRSAPDAALGSSGEALEGVPTVKGLSGRSDHPRGATMGSASSCI